MRQAMENILTNMGMSNSISKPDPVLCEDCGKERPQTQINHPFTGELRWVTCACECAKKKLQEFNKQQERMLKKRKIEKVLRLSSNIEEIKSMTFENYKVRYGAENSYQEVVNAIKNFEDRGRQGIFIFGETGNGKTHLTSAGGNVLLRKGYSVIFITEKDLLSRFAATKNFKNEESFHEIMSACLEADLLIWDDFLSSQKLTDEEKDWIFQIVNGRERGNKPIWITTNLTPQEFESDKTPYRLDDKGRTWWRLLGNMTCIYNRASNFRKVKSMSRALGITEEEYERRKAN